MNHVLERMISSATPAIDPRPSIAQPHASLLRQSLPLLFLLLSACGRGPLPEPVSQAQLISESPAAQQAKEYAPQAFAAAEKLRGEAEFLHSKGRVAESKAAGEQALASYNEAFALAQVSQAEERVTAAQLEQAKVTAALSRLDQLQSQVEADAKAYEMQARVALDTEPVKDADQMTGARLEARRLAAKQLAAEAALLCLGAKLLQGNEQTLTPVQTALTTLNGELAVGSTKADLFPRATDLRARCLQQITLARRPIVQKAPQAAESDALLAAISATGNYMVYRDDRGVVVNLGEPLASPDQLSEATNDALTFLGGVAKNYSHYPLIVVTHTKKGGEQARAQKMGDLALKSLTLAGAPNISQHSVENAQPVVFPSIKGAAEKNERIEVVFLVPGR